jgi:uncharacterized protein
VPAPGVVSELVLDSWPILEWVKGREPARSAFHGIAEDAIEGLIELSMSRINHGEVVYSIRKCFPPDKITSGLKAFGEIPIRLVSVDDRLVDAAVDLKSVYPISYADAFAVALSVRRGVPLVTGDPELRPIVLPGFRIHWLGA